MDLDMYTFLCRQQVNHLGGDFIVLLDLKEKMSLDIFILLFFVLLENILFNRLNAVFSTCQE